MSKQISADSHNSLGKLPSERDRLLKLAREKLEESGWTDEVRQLCREFVIQSDPETITHAEIVEGVQASAKSKVPDHVKAELLRSIKDALTSSSQ